MYTEHSFEIGRPYDLEKETACPTQMLASKYKTKNPKCMYTVHARALMVTAFYEQSLSFMKRISFV
jgi:hypothetical protein